MNLRRALHLGFWLGLLAGMAAGLVDGLCTGAALEQYLPAASGKLQFFVYTAALYGVFGGVVGGALFFTAVGLRRHTALGGIIEWLAGRPVHTVIAYVVVGVPLWSASLLGAYAVGYQTILRRHHKGLIVAVIIAATVGLMILALLATLVLGRVVAGILEGRAVKSMLGWLAHPLVGVGTAVVLLAAVLAGGMVSTWQTLSQLQLRPLFVIVGYLVALLPLLLLPGRVPNRLRSLGPAKGRAAVAIAMALLLTFVFAIGSRAPVRKASSSFSGLGSPLAGLIRQVLDLDRDGFSIVLGGGDCNDLDPAVYPGGVDIPGDGVDQDCVGGDSVAGGAEVDTRFVDLPDAVPRDLNVLLLIIDTVRADHVSAYGYERETTPVFDGLAEGGSLFVNAWAHAPSTRYSVPAILTGRHPSQVLWDKTIWWPGLARENHTLAEVMKEQGMTTGAILNYKYFHPKRRIDQGFDHYDNTNARLHQGKDPASTKGSSSREQSDLTIEFLENNAHRRFFLWTHYYDPHYEYERHEGTEVFGESKIDGYDHEILFTDQQIGRVIDKLKELGIYDKTAIVITSDHGEGFGERGIDFHGYHIYGPQTKIPLLIRIPGLAPREITMPVGHVDLMPTLANLVGAPSEPTMFGRSLLSEMAGLSPADADREVYQEVVYEGPTERRAVVTRDWHLIYNMVPDNTFELYDLRVDPGETMDRWGAEEVAPLKDKLLQWISTSSLPPESYARLATCRLDARPEPQLELDTVFGEALELVGADISATTVRPGDEIRITWYLRVLEPVKGSWKMFVHFRDEGRMRFNGDHIPVGGALPFSRFEPGEYIADTQTVLVPERARPGEYTLAAGIYKRRTRMEITTTTGEVMGGNSLRVETIRVVR